MKKPKLIKNKQNNMDKGLLIITISIIIFGVLMVFSASSPSAISWHKDPNYYLKRDIIWAFLGIFSMLIFSKISYLKYKRYAHLIYMACFILCIMVFVPGIGKSINNARRWVAIPGFTMMPSDYMKIASIIFLSAYLTKKPVEKNESWATFFKVMFFVGLTIVPIYLQPNFSAVIVLSASLIVLYFIGGMAIKHLFPLMILVIIGLAIAFRPGEGNYRLERLLIVFDPLKDPLGDGWQLLQSLFAVSTGGLFGVGFGQSRQKFGYLAEESHNDFIFSVFAEEFGFVGIIIFLLIYLIMIIKALRAASRCRTNFGRLLAYGLTFIISFQALINIGVAIGRVPPTGITLPFVSYGGSSLLAMCMMMGIILNISKDSGGIRKNEEK